MLGVRDASCPRSKARTVALIVAAALLRLKRRVEHCAKRISLPAGVSDAGAGPKRHQRS